MASPAGYISAIPEAVTTPDVAPSAGLVVTIFDGVVATATVTSALAVFLLKQLVLILLLLAIVESLRAILRFLLQLLVVVISLCLAAAIYVSALFVHVAALLMADPLEKAITWQQKSMLWMNTYLPTQC